MSISSIPLARRFAISVAAAGVLLLAPVALAGPLQDVAAIDLGDVHTCALRADGGAMCWGNNSYGAVGDGTTAAARGLPVDVSGLSSGVAAIAAGGSHSCALTTSGAVECWGHNNDGQVGDGTTADRFAPVIAVSSGATSISVGNEHTCAIVGGAVECWGSNFFGELGSFGATQSVTPVAVQGLGSGVASVSAGGYHTCALMSGGGVKCWGHNENGQLGNAAISAGATPVPVDVSGLSGAVAVSAGFNHTCAITGAGALKCWGKNDFGQLGDGTTIDRHIPTDVSGLGSGVLAVAAGSYHTCALVSGGGVKCWGYNSFGLGDGGNDGSLVPIDVIGLGSGAVAVAVGMYHSCAILADTTMKCWGMNVLGQLGVGVESGVSLVPVTVGFMLSQAITFAALPAHDVNDAPFTVSATASSGLPVSFSSLSTSVCTVSGSSVTLVGIGICTIAANQEGDVDYLAAPPALQAFLVGGSAPSWEPRLANISTRLHVAGGFDVAIGGFVVSGTTPKTIVVRALGPSLGSFVTDPLANPSFAIIRISDGATVGRNDDWGNGSAAAMLRTAGLAPTDPRESATVLTLLPGAYTAVVSGVGGATGVALVEVYEIDHAETPLINISTRGSVGTASDVMIGGFVVQGTTPQKVIVRGIGPSLSAYGVPGALSNPTLQLVRMSDSATIATNDDWQSAANAADVIASGFAPADPNESAILVTLDPGAYTAIVSGAGGATGVGMVEVYAVP